VTRAVRVALIDYGAGNLTSVAKGLRAAGGDVRIALGPGDLERVDALVLPGVGHFAATAPLDAAWRRAIQDALDARVPFLGICLGLQWLFDGSDEAPHLTGLGLFPGRCAAITGPVKVPHVGWNTLDRTQQAHPPRILDGIPSSSYAYFTHSYAAPVVGASVATTTHGVVFSSIVERDRIFGVQFHPEKSGRAGLRLLTNFLTLARETA
jgi:glutamine amidotransferase